MATLQQLEDALRNAASSGNKDAARKLADEIVRMRQELGPITQFGNKLDLQKKQAGLEGQLATMEQDSTLSGAAGGAARGIDDLVRLGANGISMGFLDKALGPEDRAKTNAARERHPYAGMGAEVLGSMAPMGLASKLGLTAANIPVRGAAVMAPTVDSAAYGGLTALGNDQDVLKGAAIGGGLGLFGQGVGAGINSAVKTFAGRDVPLPAEKFRAASEAGYDDMARSGLVFSPEAFGKTVDDVGAVKKEFGIGGSLGEVTDEIFPKSSRAIDKLEKLSGTASPNIQDVELLKRAFAKGGKGLDADASVNQRLAGTFRDMIDNAAPSDFVAGDVNLGIAGIQKGRQNWQSASKRPLRTHGTGLGPIIPKRAC
jgi:hypothetical protein